MTHFSTLYTRNDLNRLWECGGSLDQSCPFIRLYISLSLSLARLQPATKLMGHLSEEELDQLALMVGGRDL